MTPLLYAVSKKEVGIVQYLIEAGAELNVTLLNPSMPFLYYVLSAGLKEVALSLIDNQAVDIDASYRDITPLQYAAASTYFDVVLRLLQKGAKDNTLFNSVRGDTMLHYLLALDPLSLPADQLPLLREIFKILITPSTDLTVTNKAGVSLFAAIKNSPMAREVARGFMKEDEWHMMLTDRLLIEMPVEVGTRVLYYIAPQYLSDGMAKQAISNIQHKNKVLFDLRRGQTTSISNTTDVRGDVSHPSINVENLIEDENHSSTTEDGEQRPAKRARLGR